MQFDSKDIEAVAKSRIIRAEGNKIAYGIVGCVAVIMIGALVIGYTSIPNRVGIGWVLSIAGFVAFIVYMNILSKKQSIYKRELLEEWEKEQPQEKK